ncbi:MAG: hypothetical protein Q4G52_11260 [Clostridia bacterium]|nr:hypothetical protein [Clostridia bacterium]
MRRKMKLGTAMLLALVLCAVASAGLAAAEEHIQEVTALGFVDVDGVKLKAIALTYDQDMAGADVAPDAYRLNLYQPEGFDYMGEGAIGDILRVYVNDEPQISEAGGSGSGCYVIIEVFTDYVTSSSIAFNHALAVKVEQVRDIQTDLGSVPPTSKARTNNFGQRNKSLHFDIPDIAGFQYYTDTPGDYGAAGPAFVQEHCFNQQDGQYYDEHLAYALYLPEDYHEDGSYALLTLQNPAATKSTHPIESVLATRSPAVYASEWAQNLVKETHGLDGLIVLVPVITERVNDNGGTPAEYEAVVHLWDSVIETYHVNPDYVYGTGQSVGGMILLETNRNRDDFFAGLLLYEDQWAQNYYIDTIFARDMVLYEATAASAPMHYPRTDGYITWDYSLDTSGNPVYEGHDPLNLYYLISDDNIMITNFLGNNLSNDTWLEMSCLYSDLVGVEIEQLVVDARDELDAQNEAIRAYVSKDKPLGIQWVSFDNGSNGYSSRKLEATYEWLLTRSRQEEIRREKLDINKPFELADTQIQDESRKIYFTELDGSPIYLLTAKAGAGTQLYNTSWLNLKSVADAAPGWLPEGMSWENGVSAAHITAVQAIDHAAVAIEYDADMSGLVIRLKGDPVINHLNGEPREGLSIALDPYEFYDAEGSLIETEIKNVYVNDSAAVREGAQRESGSGRYVIVEFEAPADSLAAGVVQRTTVRTYSVIASASHLLRQ